MLLRPTNEDLRTIGYYIGRLVLALGFILLIPLVTSLLFAEWNIAVDFLLSAFLSMLLGLLLLRLFVRHADLNWSQGLTVTSFSWLVAMLLGAVPLYLSGHYLSFLDACFEAMSGFTTTGLVLVQDLDHLPHGINMWRHLMMFLGGQGIVVIGLTFLVRGTAGAYRMYVGEAREEKILPNVIQTARFIWLISFVYLAVGTLALTLIGWWEGMSPVRALLHGLWIFMATFDTGGFAPQSQSILYYHSFPFELATVAIMLLGTFNFGLHYAVWTGKFRLITKNIEVRTLLVSFTLLSSLALIGLAQSRTYANGLGYLRKGFFQLISAHTSTGYSTIYSEQLTNEWGLFAFLLMLISMAIGGSTCSTAGGVKALRIGIFFKALLQDIRRIMSPGTAIVVTKFHHLKEIVLQDRLVRSALIMLLLFLGTYLLGTVVGLYYGYPLDQAVFESVSAAANTGLSTGIVNASMPTGLKVCYLLQMWIGRLEFMSVFVLAGLFITRFTGARGRSK